MIFRVKQLYTDLVQTYTVLAVALASRIYGVQNGPIQSGHISEPTRFMVLHIDANSHGGLSS